MNLGPLSYPVVDTIPRTANNNSVLPGASPTSLLEAFIPGYGAIHKFLLLTFGFDATMVVFLYAILWLGIRVGNSVWRVVWSLISAHWMVEISISNNDEGYPMILQFLARLSKNSRQLIAETPTRSAGEIDSSDIGTKVVDIDNDAIQAVNFSGLGSKSQFRFTPAIGNHVLWFNGNCFLLYISETLLNNGANSTQKRVITLSCIGRSMKPLQDLFQYAKRDHYDRHNDMIVIKRPVAAGMRRFGPGASWVTIATRHHKPLKTVLLDPETKTTLIRDINDYLNPVTEEWYANRGIPYRRGYLFYGPPGTGKTSLVMALASTFGLAIHVVSLCEPDLTEEDLVMLLIKLPSRCIVLLEDIDAAGLARESNKDGGISLAGLLNAIDGVFTADGRVLVLTTNKPESLDDALTRPGRIDYKVAFTNATARQTKELFLRMYNDDVSQTPQHPSDLLTGPKSELILSEPLTANFKAAFTYTTTWIELFLRMFEALAPSNQKSPAIQKTNEISEAAPSGELIVPLTRNELEHLAETFSTTVPDSQFSPAEVQEYLLKWKKVPRKACENAEKWVLGIQKARNGELVSREAAKEQPSSTKGRCAEDTPYRESSPAEPKSTAERSHDDNPSPSSWVRRWLRSRTTMKLWPFPR